MSDVHRNDAWRGVRDREAGDMFADPQHRGPVPGAVDLIGFV